jgi:suppressor of ftsI
MRRSPLFAPIALVLLVAAVALAGVAASKALPSGSKGEPSRSPSASGHVHGSLSSGRYAVAAKGKPPPLAKLTPTAYGEPKVISSHNGVLRVTFAPHDGSAIINGRRFKHTRTFTGTFPGPTLHVNPGDTIEMKFINKLSQITNLHFHGFRVSPAGLADNVLRTIAPAVTSKSVRPKKFVKIVVHIPRDHEQGLYWYHPHLHGLVNGQVYPGLAGLIEVGNVLREIPWLRHIKRRLMALQAVGLRADGNLINANSPLLSTKTETNLVNGHYRPTLTIRPGELQLWQIANISNDHWYKLSFGGRKFYVIGEDGNPVGRTWASRRLLVPPAKRYSILVRGPSAGTYYIRSVAFDQGFEKYGEYKLMKVVSRGKPVRPLEVPDIVSPRQAALIRDVQNDPVSHYRQLTFRIKPPFPNAFYINNKLYNPRRVNERVNLGQTEVWLLRNVSTEDHPFHIHTNDFMVERINGHKVAVHGFQDVVMIPHIRHGKPGTVLIKQRYRKYEGEAVFHCHILFHEDHSMMGNILFGPRINNPSFGQ